MSNWILDWTKHNTCVVVIIVVVFPGLHLPLPATATLFGWRSIFFNIFTCAVLSVTQHRVLWRICNHHSGQNIVDNYCFTAGGSHKFMCAKTQSSVLPCGWMSCCTCCRWRRWAQSGGRGSAWSACPEAASAEMFCHTGCRQMASPLCVYVCALSCGVPVRSEKRHFSFN